MGITLRARRGARVESVLRVALGAGWQDMTPVDARERARARQVAWRETIKDVTAIVVRGESAS